MFVNYVTKPFFAPKYKLEFKDFLQGGVMEIQMRVCKELNPHTPKLDDFCKESE